MREISFECLIAYEIPSNLSNMFAVTAPLKAFAATFKMTGAPKGHAIHLAGITRALEFMDTGLEERRVRYLGKVSLCQRLEAVADFTGRLRALFSCSSAGPSEQSFSARPAHRQLPLHL